MASSTTTQRESDSELATLAPCTLAKALAPEDVRVGDYVAVLKEVYEFPAIIWCDDQKFGELDNVIRIAFTPQDEGQPLEVRAVCLPFVLVKPRKGKLRQIDVRRLRLARLDPSFAKVWNVGKKQKKR